MKTLQLFANNTEILGSDGIMYVDGRFKFNSILREVSIRNDKMRENYPHKVADAFAVYNGPIRNGYGKIIKLN